MRKAVFFILLLLFSSFANAEDILRPTTWAEPVAGDVVKNFYKLSNKLYRSAQPSREEMTALETFGIRELLNLRQFHSDVDEAEGTSLTIYRVPMNAINIKDNDVIEALKYIQNAKGPILMHCWHGSDRTGVIAAMYRIIYQNWSREDAIEELVKGGYGHHGFIYGNIPEYIETVDLTVIRKALEEPI